ncbi:hypothetical protein E4U41_004279 [Claviceps citrina]|nr:hypothetical protein E4U41_004279 [Claviceps citrina]
MSSANEYWPSFGIKPWQGFYTNLIVWVYIQQKHPSTNILPPTGINGLSMAEIDDRVYGSKITFTIEESMFLVKLLLGYIVVGWLVTESFFFGFWCKPFENYFRVFDGNTRTFTEPDTKSPYTGHGGM